MSTTSLESPTRADAVGTNRWYLSAAPIVRALVHLCVPMAAAVCLEQLVRAEGAARQVMIALIANLVFDVLFILVLHWGVAGAAMANLGVVGYFAFWPARHSEHLSLAPRWFTLSPALWKPVLGVGVGTLLQSAFLIVTALVLNNLAAAYGAGPLAAMDVAVRIAQVPEFLVMGVTLGVLPLLAYWYGKGDRNRLTSALRAAGGDDRERLHGPAHVAVPGDRAGGGRDRDAGDAGHPVRPDRAARQPLVRSESGGVR